MSDNVYKVLFGEDAPFLGLANEKYTEYLRRGIIIKTHYETILNNVQNTYNYNTVDITWLDGQPYTSVNVPLSYPFVSNEGWGFQVKPEIGDTVIAAFMPNSRPLILRFIKRAELLQLGQLNANTGLPILDQYGDPIKMESKGAYKPFREIKAGEYSLKSKKGAEIYADDNGAFKIITRTQDENKRFLEISCGETIIDEGTGKVKENIVFQMLNHKNGTEINVKSDGTINIKSLGINGESIEINKDKVIIGNGLTQPAVLGNDLETYLNTIVDFINSHTHLGNLGVPTTSPTTTITTQEILSKTTEVK